MESLQNFLQERFGLLQLGISAFFILLWLWSRSKEATKSAFKLREADRNLNFKRGTGGTPNDAPSSKKKAPLHLSGIVADGAPHEVLGVSALATEAEIKTAYKEKMMQYHPDRIGPAGSREWKESTRIAEAINRARNEMLEKLKRRS